MTIKLTLDRSFVAAGVCVLVVACGGGSGGSSSPTDIGVPDDGGDTTTGDIGDDVGPTDTGPDADAPGDADASEDADTSDVATDDADVATDDADVATDDADVATEDADVDAVADVPPTLAIVDADAVCNGATRALGLTVSGPIGEGPLAALAVGFTDDQGVALPFINGADEVRFDTALSPALTATVDAGSYEIALRTRLGHAFERVDSVVITVEDTNGASATTSVTCAAPATVATGELCDALGLDPACSADEICFVPPTGEDAVCGTSTAPTLEDAAVWINIDRGTIGVQVVGGDAEGDASRVSLVLRDGFGDPLTFTGAGGEQVPLPPLVAELTLIGEPTSFVGTSSGPLPLELRSPVSAASAEVRLVDAAALTSDPLGALVQRPADLVSGAACDLFDAFGRCTGDEVCGYDDGTVGTPTYCQEPYVECPTGLGAVEVTDFPVADGWEVTSVLDDDDPKVAAGTCGGDPSSHVLTFQPPDAARYRIDVASDGGPVFAALRSHCAFGEEAFELFCGDAPVTVTLGTGDPVAIVLSPATPGQSATVHIERVGDL